MNIITKFEKYNNRIITVILNKLENRITELLEKYKIDHIEKFNRAPSEYDIEIVRLTLVFDLLKSIEKYTSESDELVSFETYVSRKGNFEMIALIKRDDKTYNFTTEVITAGGYNIQTLHYRYVTKTNLPQTGNNRETLKIKEKITKLKKEEKLKQEINDLVYRMNKIKDYPETTDLTDDQIIEELSKKDNNDYNKRTFNLTWNDMIERGADINYDYSEEKFINSQNEYKQYLINSWKNSNLMTLDKKKIAIKDYEKRIKKLQDSLNLVV